MNKRKRNRWGILLVAALAAYFIYTFANQQKLIYIKNEEYKSILTKIDQLKSQNEELNKEKDMLNTDEYIEKAARELGMVKDKEKVFVDVNR